MHNLSTELLLEAFNTAIKLNLCKDFIQLLANELEKRFINESPIIDFFYNEGINMNEQEKTLQYKTSSILKKDTSIMSLNDIIEELVHVIESITKDDIMPEQE